MNADPVCGRCGRRMEPRRRWASKGQIVRYCSAKCRGLRLSGTDRDLERQIIRLLGRTDGGSSICPSEAARAVRPEHWRPLMEAARSAARRLAARGVVEWTQRGRRVDPSTARGPVRIRRGREWDPHEAEVTS